MAADLAKLDQDIAALASRIARTPPATSGSRSQADGDGFDLDVAIDLGVTAEVRDLINASKAPSTARAYAFDWATFAGWCTGRRVRSLPATPATVAGFVAEMVAERLAMATINRRLAAVAYVHEAKGLARPTKDPLVKAAIAGAARTVGEAQRQAAPVTLAMLRQMCARRFVLSDPVQRRDRAMLTLGWAAALRRSELVGLDVADITIVDQAPDGTAPPDGVPLGMVVHLRRGSKTNQTRKVETIAVPSATSTLICPVRAVQWQMSHVESGPLFRSAHLDRRLTPEYVGVLVKQAVTGLRLDPGLYTSHSLRAGFVTEMRSRGVADHLIARQTRHKYLSMLERYWRPTDDLAPSASALAGQDWW